MPNLGEPKDRGRSALAAWPRRARRPRASPLQDRSALAEDGGFDLTGRVAGHPHRPSESDLGQHAGDDRGCLPFAI